MRYARGRDESGVLWLDVGAEGWASLNNAAKNV